MVGLAMFSFRYVTHLKFKYCSLNPTSRSHFKMSQAYNKRQFSSKTTEPVCPKVSLLEFSKSEKTKVSSDRLPGFFETFSGLNDKEQRVLYEVLEEILNDIMTFPCVEGVSKANDRVKTMANYVLQKGQVGATVFLATDRFFAAQRYAEGKMLHNEEEHFRLACVLCWTIHMYHMHAALQDDILDDNKLRNNVKCWNVLEGNAPHAIRDAELIKDLIFLILRKYFKTKEYYIDLIELMHECMYCTYIGISEIGIIQPSTNLSKPLSSKLLVPALKYAFCIFQYKAIASAMLLNGFKAPETQCSVREICLDMGLIMGLSEDYIDCYADESVNEREATDIPEGKQTWLYWKALELSSPAQANMLMNSYGKRDAECVETVKYIYANLEIQANMANTFQILEKDIEAKISIAKLNQPKGPWPVILNFMKYYRGVRAGNFSRP